MKRIKFRSGRPAFKSTSSAGLGYLSPCHGQGNVPQEHFAGKAQRRRPGCQGNSEKRTSGFLIQANLRCHLGWRLQKTIFRGWDVAREVEHLTSKHKILGSNSSTTIKKKKKDHFHKG
jgi:hypothetical protein